MVSTVAAKGTKSEISLFKEVNGHYMMAKSDLEQRIQRKNGFNDADKMFSSYLDEAGWPYQSLIFDPRPYTVILEKAARLVGSKPKGRLVPREGGDTLGAYINNELLSFQWDDNSRLGESMISKWIMMDMNARKYGSAFGVTDWRYETRVIKDENGKAKKTVFYDGPDFRVLPARDVLGNPSYSYVKNWFQYIEWLTIDEMQRVNDSSRGEPIYKNLDVLADALKEESKAKSGDNRSTQYTITNKSIRGLDDYLGRDEVFRPIMVVHERRDDRWISFAPRHGVIIRDRDNPYKHREMGVIHLKYYPLGDDLYGQNELEPVSRQIRAINAHVSAYCDRIALRLRPPIHVNPVNVRMHTLEWSPEAKWLMNNPNVDVQTMKIDSGGEDAAFQNIYNVLVGSLLSALGENSQGVSTQNPMQDQGRVTATEIKDSSFTRNVRDNMNQIFLSEALKKQIMYWHSMNQQFMFQGSTEQQKIIRIVGRDAISFFEDKGLADIGPTAEEAQGMAMGTIDPSMVSQGPRYAVSVGDGMEVPKFQLDDNGEGGNLIIEPGDVMGNYDYIPDIESMKAPTNEQTEAKLMTMLQAMTNPAIIQGLAAEGTRPKYKDILIKAFEATNVIKDADALFEELPQAQPQLNANPAQPGGNSPPTAGPMDQGNAGDPGMAAGAPPMAPNANPQFMG